MALKQMPKDTILFVSEDESKLGIGYDYTYFIEKLVQLPPSYQKIYYKAGHTRDTWIDYKRTIQLKPGNKEEMIAAALADKNFLVDFRTLPASYVYSNDEGYEVKEYCTPYDGYYNHEMWMHRDDMDVNLEAINQEKVTPTTDVEKYIIYWWDADDLYVKFPSTSRGIDNAIISINMLFLTYVKVNDHLIVYRNLKPNVAKYFGWNIVDGKNTYDFRINVYKWKDLIKKPVIHPSGILENSNYFIMPKEMEYNNFIFWNGVLYTYHISENNPTYIKINGINASEFDVLKLGEIKVYSMESVTPNMESHMYIHCGINNRYKNSVDFLLPVCDSCIVYNGVDHEYVVEDDNAIDYLNSTFSLYSNVTYLSEVLSINFTKV